MNETGRTLVTVAPRHSLAACVFDGVDPVSGHPKYVQRIYAPGEQVEVDTAELPGLLAGGFVADPAGAHIAPGLVQTDAAGDFGMKA